MIPLILKFRFKKVILLAVLLPSLVYAAEGSHVKILYFFSPSCRHCIDAKPYIMDLSKTYDIEGLRFGEGAAQSFPFPVEKGDWPIARDTYDIRGVPTLAILVNGVYRQKISGMPDIRDAKVIAKGLRNGAMTVTEAAHTVKDETITITGWIVARGVNFKKAKFFITDRKSELSIKPWLPLEVVKAPVHKIKPKLMSDIIKKPVILKGIIEKDHAGAKFFVTKEVLHD
jgi:thiol-disulfide isomerase/thioredoxin